MVLWFITLFRMEKKYLDIFICWDVLLKFSSFIKCNSFLKLCFLQYFFWWYREDAVHPLQLFFLFMETISQTVSNILINFCKCPVTYSVQYERKILLKNCQFHCTIQYPCPFHYIMGVTSVRQLRDISENQR